MISQQIALLILLSSTAYFYFRNTSINLVFIPLVAAISYYFMIRDPKNTEKYRYADWTISTPLMLYGILAANKTPMTTTLSLILSDVLMIGSAVVALKGNADLWFVSGMLFFLPIIYYLYHLNENKPAIYLTILLWSLYPILWIMEKDNLLTQNDSINVYSVLDTIAKVGLVDLLM
jgi:bacteriorhodopsin